MNFEKFTIICGHYGCGKTNLALNIALDIKKRGENVVLVDLDIVNPYFRSSDYRSLLDENGIKLIAPGFAGTTLETPSLPAEVDSIFDFDGSVIIDVGGDDAGATALGRYSAKIAARSYEMLYVINKYRPLTAQPEDASNLLSEIEAASRLKASAVVNNSHLMTDTTEQTILSAIPFAYETAKRLGLYVRFTTADRDLCGKLDIKPLYPVDIFVKTPWK